MAQKRKFLIPTAAGLIGASFLAAVYFGIVALAESPQHAVDLFWQDRIFIIPIILGFGIQSALFSILKFRLFMPVSHMGPSGKMMGAGGTTSTLAMVACCAHHVTDVLPILGLTAAAAFLAEYQQVFMAIGLATTVVGIGVMVFILWRERRKCMEASVNAVEAPSCH